MFLYIKTLTRFLELFKCLINEDKVHDDRTSELRGMFEHVTFLPPLLLELFIGVNWRKRYVVFLGPLFRQLEVLTIINEVIVSVNTRHGEISVHCYLN